MRGMSLASGKLEPMGNASKPWLIMNGKMFIYEKMCQQHVNQLNKLCQTTRIDCNLTKCCCIADYCTTRLDIQLLLKVTKSP